MNMQEIRLNGGFNYQPEFKVRTATKEEGSKAAADTYTKDEKKTDSFLGLILKGTIKGAVVQHFGKVVGKPLVEAALSGGKYLGMPGAIVGGLIGAGVAGLVGLAAGSNAGAGGAVAGGGIGAFIGGVGGALLGGAKGFVEGAIISALATSIAATGVIAAPPMAIAVGTGIGYQALKNIYKAATAPKQPQVIVVEKN